jgi:Ferric reductase NAD binding domain
VWSVRDEILISNFPNLSVIVPTVSTGINSIPVIPRIDDACDIPVDTESAVSAASQSVDIEQSNQSVGQKKKSTGEMDGDVIKDNILGDTPFQKLIYVSSNTGRVSNNNTTHCDSQTSLRGGRPDLSNIFSQLALLCAQESCARVAVVTCGPSSLMDDVERLCTYRHEGVAFDLHKETFNL